MIRSGQEKLIIEFYNRVSDSSVDSVNDIPVEAMKFLYLMDYKAMATPFVIDMLISGSIPSEISVKYTLSVKEVRRIRFKAGLSGCI